MEKQLKHGITENIVGSKHQLSRTVHHTVMSSPSSSRPLVWFVSVALHERHYDKEHIQRFYSYDQNGICALRLAIITFHRIPRLVRSFGLPPSPFNCRNLTKNTYSEVIHVITSVNNVGLTVVVRCTASWASQKATR